MGVNNKTCKHRFNYTIEYEQILWGRLEIKNGAYDSVDDFANSASEETGKVTITCHDCGKCFYYTKSTMPKWVKEILHNRIYAI